LFLAKAVGSIRTSVARVPKVLDDVSRSLGLTNLETLKRITLPLAAPGVLTGFLLVLLTAMKELPATLMLRPTGYETLATEIWAATNISRYSEAAPYALVLIVIAAIPTYLLSRPDRAGSADTQENMSL
jgi:iron(III) transport system permease protein